MRKRHYEVGGKNYEVKFGEIRRASYQQVKFSRRSATLSGEIWRFTFARQVTGKLESKSAKFGTNSSAKV